MNKEPSTLQDVLQVHTPFSLEKSRLQTASNVQMDHTALERLTRTCQLNVQLVITVMELVLQLGLQCRLRKFAQQGRSAEWEVDLLPTVSQETIILSKENLLASLARKAISVQLAALPP